MFEDGCFRRSRQRFKKWEWYLKNFIADDTLLFYLNFYCQPFNLEKYAHSTITHLFKPVCGPTSMLQQNTDITIFQKICYRV